MLKRSWLLVGVLAACGTPAGTDDGGAAGGGASGMAGGTGGGVVAGGGAAGGSTAGGAAAGGSAGGATAGGTAGGSAGGDAGGSAGCSSASCNGCCLSNGTCAPVPDNRLNSSCGSNGASCADCTANGTTCAFDGSTYACSSGAAGGSAAGGSAAGGSAGGSAAGGSAAGGSAAGGSAAGGSAAGGSAAGGSAAGGSAAGGSAAGGSAAGGSAAGGSAAGGSAAGGSAAGGSAAGGSAAGGSAAGGSAAGGSAAGGSAAGGSAAGGSAAGGSAAGGSAAGGSAAGGSAAGGSAAGGSAAGGSAAGGSAAGGSAGGGTAGGSGGGCIGPPIEAYVCDTCPGASDLNNGTANCPVRTIGRGLSNAATAGVARVTVASAYNTTTFTYAENISLRPGIMVEGKWRVSGTTTLTWLRSTATSDRTVVIGTVTAIGSSIGRTAGLDGFVLRPPAISTIRTVDVSNASPTLRDFTVQPTVTTSFPTTQYGVYVAGSMSNPLITGTPTAFSTISIPNTTGTTTTPGTSTAIYVASGRAEISRVSVSGVSTQGPGSNARGIHLLNAAGTIVSDSQLSISAGATCYGVQATGITRDIDLNTLTISGCGVAITTASSITNFGVSFDGCVAGAGASPILRNSVVSVPAAQGSLVGVRSSDGCGLTIQGNSITGYRSAAAPSSSYGVICSSGPTGHDPCRIIGNSLISAGTLAGGTTSVGIACVSTCQGPSGPAASPTCQGSCAEITDNRPIGLGAGGIQSGAAATRVGILVEGSNPLIARNAIDGPTTPGFCTGIGVRLSGSGATVVNNAISAPACTTMTGIQAEASVTFTGFIASPLVHSNTVVAWPAFIAQPVSQAAVRLTALGAVDGGSGEFRNNIFQIGPADVATSAVFQEANAGVDPVALTANDYWFDSDAGMPPLYRDENAVTLTTTASINALTRTAASASQSVRPGLLVSTFPHLLPDAGVQSLGTSSGAGAPTNDYDGDPRPTLGLPDIGADELP